MMNIIFMLFYDAWCYMQGSSIQLPAYLYVLQNYVKVSVLLKRELVRSH